jgi:predicted Zn finger-like uncharacterized protein
MDVRCDRCQTEYELDDESVADAAASVQCTTCGHTFVVSRTGATLVGAQALAAGFADGPSQPPAPDWVLSTEEGQTHRFRDLTTLQKWIVERRVTREDSISQKGGPWRRLSDVDELRPFFAVVEQADRAHAETTRTVARATALPAGRHPAPAPRGHVSPDVDGGDLPPIGRDPREGVRAIELPEVGFDPEEDFEAAGLLRRRRTTKIAASVAFGLVAAGAAYLGFKEPHGFRAAPRGEGAAPPASTAAPPPVAPVAVAVARPPAPPSPVVRAPAPAPARLPSAPEPPGEGARGGAPAPEAGPARPKTYERLIAEGDRALENGQTAKAQKMYDDALKLQPSGVAAIAGSAYLLLDRQRPLAAISLFKRALGIAPTFPGALFGLGEAYRAQGQNGAALEAYKRYLVAAPNGQDAPAARRQVRDLSDSSAASRADSPSGTLEPAAAAQPAP